MMWLAVAFLAGFACSSGEVSGSDAGGGTLDVGPSLRCTEGDRDGDGYGTGASCAAVDCDETNRAIHPMAYEACNAVDEDCDGALDEDTGERACGTAECSIRIPACAEGRPSACPAEVPPSACGLDAGPGCVPAAEGCNGGDDDCDGRVDEGFLAEGVGTTYGELAARHGPCDGSAQRIGPDCNAAIHRFCRERPCKTSGFGPVENSGGNASIACVGGHEPMMVTFEALRALQPSCDGTAMRIGDGCNSGIHRWCQSMGFVSGFGPVESGPDFVFVTCLGAAVATHVPTTYAALAAHHDVCDGTRELIGPNCNAAIHRFCSSMGHASGYGPVEHGAADAQIVCVRP